MARFGGVDILVTNAGIMQERTVAEISPAEWDLTMAVNLLLALAGGLARRQQAGRRLLARDRDQLTLDRTRARPFGPRPTVPRAGGQITARIARSKPSTCSRASCSARSPSPAAMARSSATCSATTCRS